MKRTPKDIRDYTDWTEADFAEDLRTNPRYQDFYKDYDPKSVPEFIRNYAWKKHILHQRKSTIYADEQFRQSEFLSAAEDFLAVILQKKLFNVQCLWRARMIDLPHMEFATDFEYFQRHIWDCPFVEPITEAELELGIRFLLEEEDTTDPYFENWQDYVGFKIWDTDDEDSEGDIANPKIMYEYCSAEEIPDFYIYYDNHFKTGHLSNLPDLYWEKEKYYLDVVRAENARLAELKSKEVAAENEPPKPVYLHSLWAYGRERDTFISLYEDDETKELFKIDDEKVSLRDEEELTKAIEFLLERRKAGEYFPLEPHEDWYDGIFETVEKVKRRKTAEMLPYAYQTYMLGFEDEDIPALMAERMARFKFDESNDNRHWPRYYWQKTLAEAKALLGEA